MFDGLQTEQVAMLQRQFGKNELPAPRFRFVKLVGRQFKGIFNILLLVAAAVTFMLGEPIDASFVMLFVVLSVSLSVFQEYKSNAAADTLRSYLARSITVRRNGRDEEVSTTDLVPGDILKLESGDIVPADAVVLHANDFQVDETTYTGESVPVAKRTMEDVGHVSVEAYTLLEGVVVLTGSAFAEVTKTGERTRLAHIAETATGVHTESELAKGVDTISGFILRATLVTLVFVVIANMLIEGGEADVSHLLIFAIALAVSVIPEALPLVMTFALSRSALRLAQEHVIVKRLSSVQDLGSIELLCTDKTGTITENHLRYQNDYIVPESRFRPLVLARLAAHDLEERHPEPFDLATEEALSADDRAAVAEFTLTEEEAFDPGQRSNGAIVRHANGSTLHIRRGSPEYFFDQGIVSRELVETWLIEEECKGRRVLGVSYDEGDGAHFGGFVSFADTLKATAEHTILAARELNVAITIITGDALHVAEAIGRETGLVTNKTEVVEASAFFGLPSIEQQKRITDIRVFARTTPEQKLSLIELLKGHFTVGYLGEGINDAPALRAAHVSMVVQSASDVARETADIVLVKSDLNVIIDGIRLGRETYANTLKYIRTTLIANFGNFYAVAIGSLFISFLPMLPKQLLLLNLLSDFPMMAIAFDRVSKKEVARPQHYNFRSLYIIFITLGLVSTIFDFMWFALFYKISPEVLQTNWFIASVLTEIVLLFSIRSLLPIERAGLPSTPIIVLSIAAFVTTLLLPIIPVTATFFEFTPPSISHLFLILALTLVYLVVNEVVKRPLARFLKLS